MSPGYVHDGPVKIRFSSYAERPFPASLNNAAAAGYKGPSLLNVPEAKEYVAKLAAIDADEGLVYVPGETVQMHVTATGGPATIEVRAMASHKIQTFTVEGEKKISLALAPPGGEDDFQLYQVEAKQNGKVVARRGFLSMLPTGDVFACRQVMGTMGWEFIEWAYTPFDICSGFPESDRNHPPLSGRMDNRLQPWNWTTNVYNPDVSKDRVRVPDGGKDWLAQPYTEWARFYQYFGADLSSWKPESWRWGEFFDGDFQYHLLQQPDGKPGIPLESYSYITANDSIMPDGMYFREWLGSIYNAATKMATQLVPHQKVRIAEADMWNDRDMSTTPISPRILQMYVDYVRAKGLPHDDLDRARNSAQLADLVTKSGSPERQQHYLDWNMYQVNMRGREYLWDDAVKNTLEANNLKSVDWLYGNGMVGDAVQSLGLGHGISPNFEDVVGPWARFEFQTDWDYMHWQAGSYRFPGQSFARFGALAGQRILNPDVYNEKVPHADPASRTDPEFSKWCVPQDAAEHNRLFAYTSFIHYYDADGRPQRVINLDYENVYRVSQANSLGVLVANTPSDEAHALLDHRQLSEGVTMEKPIGFVGVISSPRTKDLAAGTEYNPDAWNSFFDTLCDLGVSLPAYIDVNAVDKLPAETNLIYAPRKDGHGNFVISARIHGKVITEPWKQDDRVSLALFAGEIQEAAGHPAQFSEGTTGFAYTFRGDRAFVYVENMRNSHVSNSDLNGPRPSDIDERPRTATVALTVPFSASGAQVWDLTGFLPVPEVQVQGNRVTFVAPLRAGDGRLFAVIPAGAAPILQASRKRLLGFSANPASNQLFVPWAKTAYETVSYRNPFFLSTPQPDVGRNYTQLGEKDASAFPEPARATAAADAPGGFDGSSPLFKMIAPNAIVVVGKSAPASIQATAQAVAAAVKKDGGSGEIKDASEFNSLPVSESGKYHVIAVGTVWDNEVMQRFNDPWAMDRDFTYGALGNQPAWPWMPKSGFNVGWIGNFPDDDPNIGYLVVDRSAYMWWDRAKSFDWKKPVEQQMPLRLFFRVTGSGPAGVAKAAKAFVDGEMLNGVLPDQSPTGDFRYTLSLPRIATSLAVPVPRSVDAGGGHTLTYLGWNQPDAEEYDGFYSKTGREPTRIVRAKYVPEWGMTNFLSSPHRASSYFELCIVDMPDEDAARQAAGKLAGDHPGSVTLANGVTAQKAKFGTLIVTQGNSVILESAPDPWGKALLEAYLKK